MSDRHCFTFDVVFHVHANSVKDAYEKLGFIGYLKERQDVHMVAKDLVEEFDPDTGEIITEWEEA